MASFVIYGDTSGQVTVQAPAVSGSNTITLPAETGTAITSASTTMPNTIVWNTTVRTSGFTAAIDSGNFCNTTGGAFTVTLPATPARGDFVVIVDYAGTSATNNITVSGGSEKINGGSNKLLQTNRQGITFTYIDSTQGWLATSNVYGGATPFINAPYTISYLVVAGGASAGGLNVSNAGTGGGGAGGLISSSVLASSGVVYTVTIGAGGAGTTGTGNNGSNSSFIGTGASATAIGGGGGSTGSVDPLSGGSGGGGAFNRNGAAGTPGQGFAGGNGSNGQYGGGGGGAGAVGANAVGTTGAGNGGNGGIGVSSSITGTATFYAGGGGGGAWNGNPSGTGGSGGGANGRLGANGFAGTANTGGGGGGVGPTNTGNQTWTSGAGGSGVVILSVPTANYSGTTTGSPTVTTSGLNTILTYTASGTYTA
jgi:hypothetical protein